MVYVTSNGHAERAGQCFEYAFYLMVLVLSFGLDVEVHACCVAKAFEEVREHFGRHATDFLAFEFRVPYQPWASSEVESHMA